MCVNWFHIRVPYKFNITDQTYHNYSYAPRVPTWETSGCLFMYRSGSCTWLWWICRDPWGRFTGFGRFGINWYAISAIHAGAGPCRWHRGSCGGDVENQGLIWNDLKHQWQVERLPAHKRRLHLFPSLDKVWLCIPECRLLGVPGAVLC